MAASSGWDKSSGLKHNKVGICYISISVYLAPFQEGKQQVNVVNAGATAKPRCLRLCLGSARTVARRSNILNKPRRNFLRIAVTSSSAHTDHRQENTGRGPRSTSASMGKEQECEHGHCWEREMISLFADYFITNRLSFSTFRCQINIEKNLI